MGKGSRAIGKGKGRRNERDGRIDNGATKSIAM